MRLDRAALLRAAALLPAVSLDFRAAHASTSSFINPLTGDSKASWQSDDKSFDFSVPPGWTIRQEPRGNAGHLISASATRDAGGAELEVVCDIGKSLTEYGPQKAAEQLLAEKPAARPSCAARRWLRLRSKQDRRNRALGSAAARL